MIKKFFLGTTLLLALLIVGLVVAISMVDLNKYKPKIIEGVKDASGYDLSIKGDIKTSFSPVGISISDVALAKPKTKEFLTLKNFSVALQIMPLLRQEVKVDYVLLSNLDLHVEKGKDGKFNFEVAKKSSNKETKSTKQISNAEEKAKIPLVNVDEVRIENTNIFYKDLATKSEASVQDIDILLENIGYNTKKEPKKAISFDGDLSIAKIIYAKYKLSAIKAKFSYKGAIATLESLNYVLFDSKASGTAKVDLNHKNPQVAFTQKIPNLKLVNFSKEILEKELLEGEVNLGINLATSLGSEKEIKQALNGKIMLDGAGVGIKGYDIDKVLGNYSKSQNIDAVDIGSFLVAGPVGFALSKSSDGAGAYSALKGGATLPKHLHVDIDLKKGRANLSDVALSTSKNRVAMKGNANMLNEKLAVKVGILDAKNCAKYSQSIEGTITKPKVKLDESAVSSVVNLASSLFGKSKKILGSNENKQCTAFYNGVVKHP